jgi:hypothetical protein
MLKVILLFIMLFYKSNPYKIKRNILSNKIIKLRDGCDGRYPIKEENSDEIKNIIDNYRKFELLNKLTSDKISTVDKLILIQKEFESNQINAPNITSGGLFDDFNFEIN